MNWVDLPIVFWFYSCSVLSSYAMLSFHGFFLYNAIFSHQVCYVNPHDLLRPYGCAMSFIMFHVFDRCIGLVLHTWCVVLKHFPCLCKMAFLFVFIMERGGGWILVHKWGSGLYCFLYAILMYNLSVSVLSNWVKWCFNVHSNFFVHLYWLLWSWMHVYRIEIDISIIYLSARAKTACILGLRT